MIRRAWLYARVSRDKGDDRDRDPRHQLEALREWCASRGWPVAGESTDRVTGDPARREGDPPGLRHALRQLEDRKADVLAIWAADRLVREPIELVMLVRRIQRMGGAVASIQDGGDLDTSTDAGELVVFLRGWMSRMELRFLRARVNASIATVRRDIASTGSYTSKAGRKITRLGRPGREIPAAALERAAELRRRGKGWRTISNVLAGEGHGRHPIATLSRRTPPHATP